MLPSVVLLLHEAVDECLFALELLVELRDLLDLTLLDGIGRFGLLPLKAFDASLALLELPHEIFDTASLSL